MPDVQPVKYVFDKLIHSMKVVGHYTNLNGLQKKELVIKMLVDELERVKMDADLKKVVADMIPFLIDVFYLLNKKIFKKLGGCLC